MPYDPLNRALAAAAPDTTVGDPRAANGMTLLELEEELRLRLMDRTDVDGTRRRLFINLAYIDIATSLKIVDLRASFSLPVTIDQHLYLLPKDLFAPEEFSIIQDTQWLESGRPLDVGDLSRYRGRPLRKGPVEEVFVYGDDLLVVWPKPEFSGTIAIDGWIRPVYLTEDAHCPILNTEWHEAILLLARSKVFAALKEWEAHIPAKNEYKDYVSTRLDVRAVTAEARVMRSSVPDREERLRRRRFPTQDNI